MKVSDVEQQGAGRKRTKHSSLSYLLIKQQVLMDCIVKPPAKQNEGIFVNKRGYN